MQLFAKLFGSRNERLLKQYQKTVDHINRLEVRMAALPDIDLQRQTTKFKERILKGEPLTELLPEAFAVCREAARRVLDMRPFDVQLMGAIALHNGKISEMGTGEGKTLTSALAIYLNALSGNGVHVVTVNDYLASRDAHQMGKLFSWLGLTTGVNTADKSQLEKQEAYKADITYGTNNEFGFDYLRDNMVYSKMDKVQRDLAFAIVDEVDSILIDEARTPLVISGQADGDISLFKKMNGVPSLLSAQVSRANDKGQTEIITAGDYVIDEKNQNVLLTEIGHEKAEGVLRKLNLLPNGASLYEPAHIELVHHLNAALKAHALYQKDKHYVVLGTEIVIVDEFTGRMMPGRRWSDGLHQAIEAKEGVAIQQDTQTLASITFQNYFRLYTKLAGMTGTADTEALEFQSIYNLETVVIPANRPNRRDDRQDRVYMTMAEKYAAIVEDIKVCYERKQPVLIGTTSIENSETLSKYLKTAKLPHHVLNAKNHVREAEIIAQAGKPGAITIATNMAGRGTDIVLGGSIEQELTQLKTKYQDDSAYRIAAQAVRDAQRVRQQAVIEAGGLHIIGTERHESRRVDNQLRGRAGRQGDPGSSRFYLSFEDPLIRIFAGEKVQGLLDRLSIPTGTPIEAGLVTRSLESAQRKVEAHHYEVRKELLEYDAAANDQRRVIYTQRDDFIVDSSDGIPGTLREGVIRDVVHDYVAPESVEEEWDLTNLDQVLVSEWRMPLSVMSFVEQNPSVDAADILEHVLAHSQKVYASKVEAVGPAIFHHYERLVMLQAIDSQWREHLAALDTLREGIHLRGYAQKDPKQEYKREAFEMFSQMLSAIGHEVVKTILTTEVQSKESIALAEDNLSKSHVKNVSYNHAQYETTLHETDDFAVDAPDSMPVKRQPIVNAAPKVGRNEPCPCGSGRKFKSCHGNK